jgi:hypothetical protein
MKLSMYTRLQRRDFVKWIGGAAFALPGLELFELQARAQTTAKQAKLAVFIYTNDGMYPPAYFPPTASTDPTASPILSTFANSPGGNNHKSQILVLGAPVDGKNFPLNNTGLTYNIGPAQHRANVCLTASQVVLPIVPGQATTDSGPSPVALDNKGDGPSIDYVIAQNFKQNPLLMAMHPCGGDTPSEVTYDQNGNPLTRLYQASTIASQVFNSAMPGMPGADPNAIAKQQALTNFLNGQFATLRPQLSTFDRMVMDQHLTQLQAYEAMAQKLLSTSGANSSASCAAPSTTGIVPTPTQDGSEIQALSKFIMDTTSIVFSCNMYNVVTISMGYPGGGGVGGLRAPWLTYNGSSFDDPLHFLSHNGGDPVLSAKYALINGWIVSQMALLMDVLKGIQTATGTLLDDTVIYLTNRHGDGNTHSNFALPGIIGGGAGGYFKMGQYVSLAQPTSPTDVLISIASAMGVPVPQFPLPTFQGVACPSANGPYVSKTELTQIKA